MNEYPAFSTHPQPSMFHAELRTMKGYHHDDDDMFNSLAFLCSALSPVRTAEQLVTDAQLDICNWQQVFALASNRLVAPLLFIRLQQKQLAHHCPEEFVDALAAFHQANSQRNVRHRHILLEAVSLLNGAGVTPILLKGAHSLVDKMPDANERIISDIDLLVPPGQVSIAYTVLLEAGYYHEALSPTPPWVKDTDSHHLKPLFHPNGQGYIELHRHPNYSRYYRALVPQCFTPDNMLYAEQEGVAFHHNHPWQLLLYNQVHHYHSCMVSRGVLDIRHLAEQSALLASISDFPVFQEQVGTALWGNTSISHLQFTLLATLFGHDLPASLLVMGAADKNHYHDTLTILLGNQRLYRQKKVRRVFQHMRRITEPGWLHSRIFNLAWYRSRPEAIRQLLKE